MNKDDLIKQLMKEHNNTQIKLAELYMKIDELEKRVKFKDSNIKTIQARERMKGRKFKKGDYFYLHVEEDGVATLISNMQELNGMSGTLIDTKLTISIKGKLQHSDKKPLNIQILDEPRFRSTPIYLQKPKANALVDRDIQTMDGLPPLKEMFHNWLESLKSIIKFWEW